MKKNVIIMGAAGRDYENFIVYFKDNPEFNVVCFTQAQIPGIEKRSFPKELAGELYKNNIPFYLEEKLPELIKKFKVDYVYLCYSDLSTQQVLDKASVVLSSGANFALLGTNSTYLKSKKW
jgi:predicted GTPase